MKTNNKSNEQILGMRFVAEFDREVDLDYHYIVPGGYCLQLKDGREIQFDFSVSHGDEISKNEVLFEVSDLLVNEFPEALTIKKSDILSSESSSFSEFFIFNGDKGDPEIYCTKISDVVFEFDMGDKISDVCFLGDINLCNNREMQLEQDIENVER